MERYLWILILTLCVSCAKPIPAEFQPYTGLWQNDHTSINIDGEGYLHYRIKSDENYQYDSLIIREIKHNVISAGYGSSYIELDIDSPPKEDRGYISIEIDGTKLYKVNTNGRILYDDTESFK